MIEDHLEKLKHFAGVARNGSIRKYAIVNNLSQPAISKCIQILEAELEVSLLVRSHEGVLLTQAGRRLLELSDNVFALAKNADEQIRGSAGMQLTGNLTMGTYQSIAVYFVPKFLKFIEAEQGALKINIECSSSVELVRALHASRVDFIVSVDPPKSAEFFQLPLYVDTYSLYQPNEFSAIAKTTRIFTVPSAKDRKKKTLSSYLKDADVINQVSSCSDFEAVKSLVEGGVGIGLMPDRVAVPLVEKGKIKLVGNRKLTSIGEHSVVFSCRAHRASDHAMKWIGQQVQLMLSGAK
jgi:DNA-binding transcriptional LysR family regulator